MRYGEGHDGDGDEDELMLPGLRRLHLASPISFDRDLFLHHLRPLAPRLAHLHLSELLAFDYDMARALHSELAEPRAVPVDWERSLPHSSVASSFSPRRLPPVPEQLCGCCSGYYRVYDVTRLLREIARGSLCDRRRSGGGAAMGGWGGGDVRGRGPRG